MTPKELSDRYIADFAEADNPLGLKPSAPGLALKLVEEAIELALELSNPGAVYEAFMMIFGRQSLKKRLSPSAATEESIQGELADCSIVLDTLQGLLLVSEARLAQLRSAKIVVNEGRAWEVNEFGALTNRGVKPQVVKAKFCLHENLLGRSDGRFHCVDCGANVTNETIAKFKDLS
jgi:hypothetical protein